MPQPTMPTPPSTPPAAARRKSPLLRLLAWIGPALLFGLFLWAGPADLWAIARRAAPGPLLLAFALNLPQLGLKAWRWQQLVRWQGMRLSYPRALLAYFSSLLVGFMTPGRLGEMAKALTLRVECGAPLAAALSSVVVDRVFDMYLLLALGSLGIVRYALVGSALSWPFFIGFCVLAALPLALLHGRVARWTVARLVALAPLRSKPALAAALTAKVEQFAQGLDVLTPRRVLHCTVLTAAAYYLFFIQCQLTARALGMAIPLADLALLMAATNFISFVPISVSGLGTREACLVYFLGRLPQPHTPEMAVALGLALFLVLFVGGGLIGLVSWWLAPIGLREAWRDWKFSRRQSAP